MTYQCHHQVIHCVYTTHMGTLGTYPERATYLLVTEGECSPCPLRTLLPPRRRWPTLSPRSAWKPKPVTVRSLRRTGARVSTDAASEWLRTDQPTRDVSPVPRPTYWPVFLIRSGQQGVRCPRRAGQKPMPSAGRPHYQAELTHSADLAAATTQVRTAQAQIAQLRRELTELATALAPPSCPRPTGSTGGGCDERGHRRPSRHPHRRTTDRRSASHRPHPARNPRHRKQKHQNSPAKSLRPVPSRGAKHLQAQPTRQGRAGAVSRLPAHDRAKPEQVKHPGR